MAALTCDIVTPVAKLFSSDVYMVVVPGVEGEMGFLPGHAPLVSVLANGVARVQETQGAENKRFALHGGYVQVTGEKVIILADRALPTDKIDVANVKETLAELQSRANALSEEELAKTTLNDDIEWCRVQLHATQAA